MADDYGREQGGTLFTSRRTRRRSPVPPVFGVLALVAVGLGIGAWWLWFRTPETMLEPVSAPAADSVAPVPEEPFVLPALGASDGVVRRLVAGVSAHPRLAAWLVPDDLIRRFVEGVVDLSRGSSPLPAMEMLIPEEPFLVRPAGDGLEVDPRSPRRYDLLAEVVGSLDPEEAAEVYGRLLPLFREAYAELGVAEGPFEEVLDRAIENLLAVDIPEGPLEVKVAVGRFVYADRAIESLTPAQKHLVRMGPENARRVQEKLREISGALALLPAEDTAAEDMVVGDTVAEDTASVEGGGEGG